MRHAAAVLIVLAAALPGFSDAVLLKNGARYIGDVSREDEGLRVRNADFPEGVFVRNADVKKVYPAPEALLALLTADYEKAKGLYGAGGDESLKSALDLLFEIETQALDALDVYPGSREGFEGLLGQVHDLRKLCREGRTLEGEVAPEPKPEPQAPPEPPADRIGTMPARQVAAKAIAALRQSDGYGFRWTAKGSNYGVAAQGYAWKNGIVRLALDKSGLVARPAGTAATPGTVLFRRGAAAFAEDRFGALVPAASAGEDARRAAALPLPDALLASVLAGSARARFLLDAEAGGAACRVIEVEAGVEELKAHVEVCAKAFDQTFAGGGKDAPFDRKLSWMRYRVYVAVADVGVRRVEREAYVRYGKHASLAIGGTGPYDQTVVAEVAGAGGTVPE
ncbi:MAG: hypothetical protein HYY18_02460, partial [Planctomycetes bacterium]|nr:hypothetical protein [Planctomycetota bacterium]